MYDTVLKLQDGLLDGDIVCKVGERTTYTLRSANHAALHRGNNGNRGHAPMSVGRQRRGENGLSHRVVQFINSTIDETIAHPAMMFDISTPCTVTGKNLANASPNPSTANDVRTHAFMKRISRKDTDQQKRHKGA